MCSDAEFSTFALANVNAYILDKFLPSICLCSQFFFFAKQKREIFFRFEGIKKEKREKREKKGEKKGKKKKRKGRKDLRGEKREGKKERRKKREKRKEERKKGKEKK